MKKAILPLLIALFFGGAGFFAGTLFHEKNSDDCDTDQIVIEGDTTAEMVEHVGKQHELAEKKYEEALARARRHYETDNTEDEYGQRLSEAFREEQRAWEAFREAQGKFNFSLGGSFSGIRATVDDITILNTRADELIYRTTEGNM